MRKVGIKVLKNKLSEYIRLAAAGETVQVTDRGRVVVELSPPDPGRAAFPDDPILARLVREGRLTPAKQRGGPPLPRHPIMSFEEMMRDLDESRKDRWST